MRLKRFGAWREFAACHTRDGGDWLRDSFGADAGFTVFVAEASDTVIGMATCSQPGWNGPVVFLQDLFVEPAYRKHGVARALMARVASLARHVGSRSSSSPSIATIPRRNSTATTAFSSCRNA